MTDEKKPRMRRGDAEKARAALGVAERHLARLVTARDTLMDRLDTVKVDIERVKARVEYLSADPALGPSGDDAGELDRHPNVAAPVEEKKPIDVTGLTVLQDPLDPFAAF